MNYSDIVMAKKKKCNLNFLDNVYTTISGFKYNDDNCSDGFKRDLDYILNSITYNSIISFTCSCTIGHLFAKIEGFYGNIDGKKIGIYKGADVIVDNMLSILDNEFTVEYVE